MRKPQLAAFFEAFCVFLLMPDNPTGVRDVSSVLAAGDVVVSFAGKPVADRDSLLAWLVEINVVLITLHAFGLHPSAGAVWGRIDAAHCSQLKGHSVNSRESRYQNLTSRA